MLRKEYSHKRATAMFAAGKSESEVAAMLLEEGATADEAPPLAREYQRNFVLYSIEQQVQKRKQADSQKLIGAVLLAGGLALSGLMYMAMSDGNYVLFYGLILSGGFLLVKALSDQKQAETMLVLLEEKERTLKAELQRPEVRA